jgi:hypothetical protein
LHGDADTVEVAPVQRHRLLGAQTGLGGEHRQRPVHRPQLDREPVDLARVEHLQLRLM